MSLPASTARLLTDSLASTHPDIPGWSPPANLPPLKDLRDAIRILERGLVGCPVDAAIACLAAFQMAYEGKKVDQDVAEKRAEIWLQVNGDLPKHLWEEATLIILRNRKFSSYPTPGDFRATVIDRLHHGQRMLERAKQLLAMKEAPAEEQYVDRPQHVRSTELANSFRKVGNLVKAEYYEKLAEKEKAAANE